ncbi:MAG: peptidoglycan editing factor PgeF [Pseudomonadota bacterium]
MAEASGLQFERAAGLSDVAHGFFGSAGGRDQYGFGGPGDPVAIASLRARAAHAIAPGAVPVLPHQTHSSDVLTVTQAWPDEAEGRPRGDAVVTARRGLALGVVTADCGPLLLADPSAGVIGAAHAGWRGAHGGVLAHTIAAMEALGAQRNAITAAIGPTIAQRSYEVDAAFKAHFEPREEAHFRPAPERAGKARWHFDLPGYIRAALARERIGEIFDCARDTYSNPERYHSYRRVSQAGEPAYGRQISLISLG